MQFVAVATRSCIWRFCHARKLCVKVIH